MVRRRYVEMLADKVIDDYHVCEEITLWNFSGYYTALDENTFDGNPFYRCRYFCLYSPHTPEMFFTGNWNDLLPSHSLGKEFMCYTFHWLYDHSHLTLEDILRVEEIDININTYSCLESRYKNCPER